MSTDLFSSEAGVGSLGVRPLLPVPPIPNIVAEWAAILPLVTHLANQRDDYTTTGDTALAGRLTADLLPRLGTLSGYCRLLKRSTKFLDYASTRGGSSRTVWDVSWGNVFPCANGAATSALTRYLLARSKIPPQTMPEKLPQPLGREDKVSRIGSNPASPQRIPTSPTLDRSGGQQCEQQGTAAVGATSRRSQVLHVFSFYRKQTKPSLRRSLVLFRDSGWYRVVSCFCLVTLAAVLILVGAYGTSVLILCCTISEVVAWNVKIDRPPGYLFNNESHDAFMLLASHQNATEWNLMIGDRGVVDSLLNKPMFMVPEGRRAHVAAFWFWVAHLLQLSAMTFVAAQKGWDGISLLTLLGISGAWRGTFGESSLVSIWLQTEGVDAEVKSFAFGGRNAMMGTIQLFSGTKTTRWMDNILVPHSRREALLKSIQGVPWEDGLSESDCQMVASISEAVFAAVAVLRRQFGVVDHVEAGE